MYSKPSQKGYLLLINLSFRFYLLYEQSIGLFEGCIFPTEDCLCIQPAFLLLYLRHTMMDSPLISRQCPCLYPLSLPKFHSHLLPIRYHVIGSVSCLSPESFSIWCKSHLFYGHNTALSPLRAPRYAYPVR